MTGIEVIAAERQRQIDKEGWTPKHDDEHTDGSLLDAAMAYLSINHAYHITDWANYMRMCKPHFWPISWDLSWWKPKNRRSDLVRAGALIAAEIDRLDRIGE